MPAGASGTAVEVLTDGGACVIEVLHPRHRVVTVHDEALAAG